MKRSTFLGVGEVPVESGDDPQRVRGMQAELRVLRGRFSPEADRSRPTPLGREVPALLVPNPDPSGVTQSLGCFYFQTHTNQNL